MIKTIVFSNKLEEIDFSQIDLSKNQKIWVDITNITREEMELVKTKFNLHYLTAEDLFNSGIRIKVEEFEEYLFCVFYGVKSKKFELIEIDFALGKNYLITNHKGVLDSANNLHKDYLKLEKTLSKGADFLFHKILDMEVDNYFPILEVQDDKINTFETQAIKKPTSKLLSEILALKRKLSEARKKINQQREKTSFLAKNDYLFISKKSIPYFRDVYDHMVRVNDVLDNYREATSNAFDVYMATMSNNMNEVMKILSIIATIALPLTVISGIYGTNFTTLPGSTLSYGFWIMIVLMIMMILGMLFYFRKKNWL